MTIIVIYQQPRAHFWSIIDLSNYTSILCPQFCFWGILIVNWSTKEPIWYFSNFRWPIRNIMNGFNPWLVYWTKLLIFIHSFLKYFLLIIKKFKGKHIIYISHHQCPLVLQDGHPLPWLQDACVTDTSIDMYHKIQPAWWDQDDKGGGERGGGGGLNGTGMSK